jgi:hypothetical protein
MVSYLERVSRFFSRLFWLTEFAISADLPPYLRLFETIDDYPNVKSDDDLFYSLIFTRRASRRLPSAALLRVRNSLL